MGMAETKASRAMMAIKMKERIVMLVLISVEF